jgi:hypothetical protein
MLYARRATKKEAGTTLETVVEGEVEARHVVRTGDYIIHGSRGGRYPMRESDFEVPASRPPPAPVCVTLSRTLAPRANPRLLALI